MKNLPVTMRLFFTFMLFADISTAAPDRDNLLIHESQQRSGLSGYAQLLSGVYSGSGLGSDDDGNSRINSLGASARDYEQEFITAYWGLSYRLNRSDTRWFIGTPDSGATEFEIPIEVGVSHTLADETIVSVAYVPRLSSSINSKVWQDPYLTRQNRRRTGVVLEAVRFSAEYILGSPFSLMYDYGEKSIDRDRAGESLSGSLTAADLSKLQRDKTFSRSRIQLTLPLASDLYFVPEVNYLHVNAEGSANSYDASGLEMTVVYQAGHFNLFGHIYLNDTQYREVNPVFKVKKRSDSVGVTAGVSYRKPFGWRNTTLDFIVSDVSKNSNIHFYDKREELIMSGLTYWF